MENTNPAVPGNQAEPTPAAPGASAAVQTPAAESASLGQKLLNLLGLGDDKGGAPAAKDDGNGSPAAPTTPDASTAPEKAFTQADVDAAVAAALAAKDKEAQRAKMSPEERAKAEAADKDQEIVDLKAQLLRHDLRDTAIAELTKAGYPVALADLLDYSSEENMKKSLDGLQATFKSSLEAALKEKLRGKTPAGLGDAGGAEGAVRDQIAQNIRGGLN